MPPAFVEMFPPTVLELFRGEVDGPREVMRSGMRVHGLGDGARFDTARATDDVDGIHLGHAREGDDELARLRDRTSREPCPPSGWNQRNVLFVRETHDASDLGGRVWAHGGERIRRVHTRPIAAELREIARLGRERSRLDDPVERT